MAFSAEPTLVRDPSGFSRGCHAKSMHRNWVCWVGGTVYFALATTSLPFEKLEKWSRRRLRQVRWKEWKRPQTRYRNLRALGIPDHDARSWAASQKGYWRVAGSWPLQRALPNAYWHQTMGLKGFTEPYRRFREC